MQEYVTHAFVLRVEPAGEADLRVYLYTEKHGQVSALARSARKPSGRLASHLQPLAYVHVRIVERKGAQVVDALRVGVIDEKQTPQMIVAKLGVADLISRLTTSNQRDDDLWNALRSDGFISSSVLRALGFDASHARCAGCGSVGPKHFVIASTEYVCGRCLTTYTAGRGVVLQ